MISKIPDNGSTVAIGFVSGMLIGPQRAGQDISVLLKHAQIATTVLLDPQARIPVSNYAALYRRAITELNDEAFALFSHPMRLGSFELLCRAMLSADRLGDVLERLPRFLAVVLDDMELKVCRRAGVVALAVRQTQEMRLPTAGRVFAYEWLLRMIHGLLAWLVAHPLPLNEVAFPYPPPPHAADYEHVFAPRFSFNADKLEARFPAQFLSLPVRRDEAALRLFLANAPQSITTLYRRDRAVMLRVREHLRAALPHPLSLPEVAQRLGVSQRTLHRQLLEEQTSFRGIRETLRRDLALDWLAKSGRPLSQIGADLGFADAASFYRAFVAWRGIGPREYRKRLRET
ncbi:MAG: AraC family transcriptional regulator [Rhodocyclaceae bacterium]|nr:AraC family transcriptional regulator [Rhodocyclaceae bacterium]